MPRTEGHLASLLIDDPIADIDDLNSLSFLDYLRLHNARRAVRLDPMPVLSME